MSRLLPPLGLALLIAALILTPVDVWRPATVDARYMGFDPNLMFVSATGPGTNPGTVRVSPSSVVVTALPGSHPTIHLLTTPLGFSAKFDVVIRGEAPRTLPLRIGLWSPSTRAGYFIVFDRDASDEIRVQTIVDGQSGQDLIGGRVLSSKDLGQYVLGQPYHITFDFEKVSRIIRVRVQSTLLPPVGSHAVRLGTPVSGIVHMFSTKIPVTAGQTYSIGGWINRVAAESTYALGVQWYDRAGRLVPSDPNVWWHSPAEVAGWTNQTAKVVAPDKATNAEIFLGTGPASTYLFGGIFFHDAPSSSANLVENGSFERGLSKWTVPINNRDWVSPTELLSLDAGASVYPTDSPQVFEAFRPTFTFSSSSDQGVSQVAINNFVLTVPSQPANGAEMSRKVDDPLARQITAVLWVGALLMCFLMTLRFLLPRLVGRFASNSPAPTQGSLPPKEPAAGLPDDRSRWFRPHIPSDHSTVTAHSSSGAYRRRPVIFLGSACVVYLIANAVLFGVASPHFDIVSSKIWTYIGYQYGLPDLYYRPLLVTAADAWLGSPRHEAVFSYGITKAYYYVGLGWLYKLFLSPPGPFAMGAYSLEELLKAVNVLFALIDGALIYNIMRRLGNYRGPMLGALLFVLNPALVFVMSVWGSTETISLFFILASIWLAEKNKPLGAWVMLAAGAYTRPQMLVVAFLLGLVYLRKFSFIQTIISLSWTVIAMFVLLGPFALAISPSLPVDYVTATFAYHLGNGQADPGYLGTTPGYYSIWTLPLELVNGRHGLSRMWSPSTQIVVNSLTYAQLGTVVSIGFILVVGAVILASKRPSSQPGRYLPLVALGVLGWLMLTPGLISRYFIYGLAIVLLCRHAFRLTTYLWMVGTLSLITLLTSYGHVGLDFLGYGNANSLVSPNNNAISQAVFALFSDDRVITLGTAVNLATLAGLGVAAIQSTLRNRALSRQLVLPAYGLPAR